MQPDKKEPAQNENTVSRELFLRMDSSIPPSEAMMNRDEMDGEQDEEEEPIDNSQQ